MNTHKQAEVLIRCLWIVVMGRAELWDKLELDKSSDIDWVAEYNGLNGLEMMRKRVLERLKDDDTYETASKIFAEELENC